MFKWLGIIFGTVGAAVRCRHDLATENLALGHVPGELIFTRYGPGCALCENRVTRLCMVVIGTAFATDALRHTVN